MSRSHAKVPEKAIEEKGSTEVWTRRRFLTFCAGATSALYLLPSGCKDPELPAETTAEPNPDVLDGGAREQAPEPSGPEEFYEDPPKGKIVPFAPNDLTQDDKAFPLGIMAGAMRANSALVWTFAEGLPALTIKVWRPTETAGSVEMLEDKEIKPDAGGYLKHAVSGLRAGLWYEYAFVVGDKRSPIGRFRTALPPGSLAPITIGATSCTNRKYHMSYPSLQALAKEKPDLFMQLGDMSYNDTGKDLADYRKIWRDTLNDVGYRAILPATGVYITWDDHEVDNDWDPESIEPKRLEDAKQSFFETLPVERGPKDRLWNKYRWGNTAEIFLMDCRAERKPSTRTSDDPIYIGKAQMAWLKDSLKQSRSHFKILMNSVPITNMPQIWLKQEDRWEGYAKQRAELLDFIVDEKIENVWFLTGDFHVGFVSQIETEGKWSHIREIAPGPGASGPNPLGGSELAMPTSQFEYHSAKSQVMTTLTFDPKANHVHARFIDVVDGSVLFDKKLTQIKG